MVIEAYELVGAAASEGPFVLTCEHASRALPPWLRAAPQDEQRLDEHWGWDIGAADITRSFVELTNSCAVLATFSRLVADANRTPEEESYIPRVVEGTEISFNRDLSQEEHQRRTRELFTPYHQAVDCLLRERLALGPARLLAIHSFTPVYRGEPRTIEIGVLFNDHEEHAQAMASSLRACGFDAVLNQPYTGKAPDGLIYSAKRHGEAHELPYLEFEIRQDLIDTPSKAQDIAVRMLPALEGFYP